METYFSSHQKPFPNPVNSKIKTNELLQATTGLVDLLDKLGKVFAPVRYDMIGNVEKITKKYDEDHSKNEYVEDMLLADKNQSTLTAIDALMWLRRGLHFFLEFFEIIINDTTCNEDLRPCITTAYSNTLKKYHGWFGSNLFNLLSRLVPQRKMLLYYMALDKENCEEIVIRDLRKLTVDMRVCVEHLFEFYKRNGLESESKE